ncbi:FMN-dependent NADH-azoreductase [Gayadomonas joobiniege]|uniref:FMN-dependent NADH-azoreductase n=1 Tax=Gayadomonas joobiniege TaxID=1234606 RepID=UPI000381435F|nr:NAD(P)H-dependent oxidoreductase [Gayadomonas joobiniege]
MKTKLLRIDSSVFGEQGVSTQLIDHLIKQKQAAGQQLAVTHRSFSEQAIPHLDAKWIQALATDQKERSEQQKQQVAFSNRLIDEVMAADEIVIALPMYNFSLPSMLKAWFDHIARAGTTFKYTEKGPVGLVEDKPVYLVTTRGGQHKDTARDTQISYVKTFLAFIGLTQVHVIYAEGLNMQATRDSGLAEAKATIDALVSA